MKTWAERIAEARKRGSFTDEDLHLVESWESCAVGEAHNYDRHRVLVWFLTPGRKAMHEGMTFMEAVRAQKVDMASQLLGTIQSLFGQPSNESLIAATVAEAKEHAAEPELVEA